MQITKKLSFLAALILGVTPLSAAPKGKIANPDFTKGDPIPAGAVHDWNLGATGARGWMFSESMVTSSARQIRITEVEKDTPADGILVVGDVILGVSDKPFSYDPRTEFGKALSIAESKTGDLALLRWRDGKAEKVTLKLPVLGSYSATAPYDCQKSQRILEQGCEALAKQIAGPSYKQNPISRSLNALALLASGNPDYLPIVRKEAQWAAGYSANGFQTWYYGYAILFLSEYVLATGDQSVMPGLRRLAMESANGQSVIGSWGHKFANDDGRLLGYGMMHSPGVPLTTSLVMARAAGVKAPAVTTAIERSAKLLRFYTGTGAIPYGDHNPWIQNHEDNGKCGMTAVLFSLLNEPGSAEFFSRMSTASHGPERDTGHTGNFFNVLWSVPAIARSGPHATGAWMEEFGGWYFDLARRSDGTFPHQGPPQMRNDSYRNWDCTGGYLLAYAMPLKKTYLTGKRRSNIPQLNAKAAKQLILDGRGWSNKDRYSAYDKLSPDSLLSRLSSWSPIVRERAAMALARRKGKSQVTALPALLESPDLYGRIGACQALAKFGGRSAAAVPALRNALKADDLWLRIKAADALAAIGKPAMKAVPELLEMLTQVDKKNDPRGMQQRYLSFALFNSRGGLLGRSLEGVDRDLLFKAVRAGLRNQDGRARGSFTSVYRNLSYDELKPLIPSIYRAIVEPSPSGIMFGDQIQTGGLALFSKHHVSEGIELLADYVKNQKPHASEKRIHEIIKLLKNYGAHSQRAIPKLEAAIHYFENDEPDFPKRLSMGKAQDVREAIKAIKASKERPKLIKVGKR
ncbi:MAG: hypothetical protein ACI9SQ_001344 [Rubritalea sp.]|jgi:hypothetical protein